jgi:multidrug efflux pump subunit AcrA (membrane-fusion protein)
VFTSPALDPATSMGVVRVAIDAAPDDVALKLGLAGSCTIEVAERHDAVLVPAGAIRRSASGVTEVVVCSPTADGYVAEARAIRTSATRGADAVIEAGLAAGEQVVTRHVLGLEDGAALAPAPGAP